MCNVVKGFDMRVIKQTGNQELARVFIAENKEGKLVEFVESTQPPFTFSDKYVLIISTLFGCPVDCKFCDAGGDYRGKLSPEELLFQMDYAIEKRFGGKTVESEHFKVQFARMGEPSFNHHVLEALQAIPGRYSYRKFTPSLSTIGPAGRKHFFDDLLRIKKDLFRNDFQLQFSIHSTDTAQRDNLLPVKKMSFEEIAGYGKLFYDEGGKKITLNFALGKENIVELPVLKKHFPADHFLIKLTPVNPTYKAGYNHIESRISRTAMHPELADELRDAGYDVILSIGEWEENRIGSNCGQYVCSLKKANQLISDSYTYQLEPGAE